MSECKLCDEGIPLKMYFNGQTMHFDGFMAWTACPIHGVRVYTEVEVKALVAEAVDKRIDFLTREINNGGNFEHLDTRRSEAQYLRDLLVKEADNGTK